MRIIIDTRQTVEQNAALYYERAKKAKRKLEGTKRAIAKTRDLLAKEAAGLAEKPTARVAKGPIRKRDWFEAFRWFYSSDGFLCIGGRDATTNEVVIKKHALEGDAIFHTDMAGSPFVVVKSDGKEIPVSTREEAAMFTACASRAWKSGAGSIEVFGARPDQVSKTPNPGEYMPKGAFVVRGARDQYRVQPSYAVGKDAEGRVMGGPQTAVLKHCEMAFSILQGEEKASDVAKRLAHNLEIPIDDALRALPPGNVKFGKRLTASKAQDQ
jgi:predicted ribosome quality control (RQC) complex YloA/Tae2 family protein